MKTIISILSLQFLLLGTAFSQDSRMQKAVRIGQALGLESLLRSAQLESGETAKRQILAMVEQLRKNSIPETLLAVFGGEADSMAARVTGAWDPQYAARLYADGLVEVLSDSELVSAEHYYASDQGKRTFQAIETSSTKMREYINAKTTEAIDADLSHLIIRVKDTAKALKQKSDH